ncbi:MAG: hypothetical protein HFH30_01445 [Eubacterium sp.]|nr:hypothetical protein [Eubacterium sp.]MCI8920080.1 hypothetical protein [Eubacterium sp.]
MTERACRYGDHGIYITAKQKRKRIFIPLTDSCRHKRQLYIRLNPGQWRMQEDFTLHIQ